MELIAKPDDGGPEQWTDRLKLKKDDEHKKKFLWDWFNERIGKTIDSIYRSEFNFEK